MKNSSTVPPKFKLEANLKPTKLSIEFNKEDPKVWNNHKNLLSEMMKEENITETKLYKAVEKNKPPDDNFRTVNAIGRRQEETCDICQDELA